ncbi:hypothetical protein [Bosea sp. FBZP-16]|uniref:antitoxin Xre/MbcA/ParS-like domain-containing protein n=1 Tax=Bosea sp. FBZP-16 TaxID=2065382 RepID=UPI000C30A9A6|nr:hypothetical protein [Bosea sp. FBZP-16]
MVASVRRVQTEARIAVDPAALADVLKVLARHNPGLSKTALEATGKVMAVVSAAASRLSVEQQRRVAGSDSELARAVEAVVEGLATGVARKLIELPVEKPVEISQGSGLGRTLDLDEGRRRLVEFAKPVRLEDWAGPVAGPGDIEKMFGTKRSTLHEWQKRGAVIGLLKGERKHVFPLAQFVDGRPVEGMPQVMRIIGHPRAAWQWLIQTKPSLGETPLDGLKSGRLHEVLDAASRDFG